MTNFRAASIVGYHPPSDTPGMKNSTRKRARAREAGAFEVDSDLRQNVHLNPDPDRRFRLNAPELVTQADVDALPEDERPPSPTPLGPRPNRHSDRPVWEEIGATPLVIDFSNVMEPIHADRLSPNRKLSRHPMAPLHRWARDRAYEHNRGKTEEAFQDRNEWYWREIDRGRLPADFNPYPPNSARHSAFEERYSLVDDRATAPNGQVPNLPVLQTPAQLRKRARRKMARGVRLSEEEFELLCGKPLELWDVEELAAGYPKNKNGQFVGKPPGAYMRAEMRERVDALFKEQVKAGMNSTTVAALTTLQAILDSDAVDHRGKPTVAASTKLDAAKFLVEHLLGKPKQTVESDISVKLQGLLAGVMVSPEQAYPSAPGRPVADTGRMLAGQRGHRSDYVDEELRALERAGIIDAEIVGEDDD